METRVRRDDSEVGVITALLKDLSTVPSTTSSGVDPAPGYLMSSSGLCGHHIHSTHKQS